MTELIYDQAITDLINIQAVVETAGTQVMFNGLINNLKMMYQAIRQEKADQDQTAIQEKMEQEQFI